MSPCFMPFSSPHSMIHLPPVCSITFLPSAFSGRSSENQFSFTASRFSIVDLPWPCSPSSTSISSNLQPGCRTRRTAATRKMRATALLNFVSGAPEVVDQPRVHPRHAVPPVLHVVQVFAHRVPRVVATVVLAQILEHPLLGHLVVFVQGRERQAQPQHRRVVEDRPEPVQAADPDLVGELVVFQGHGQPVHLSPRTRARSANGCRS